MENSTHRAEVVNVVLEKHKNADLLSIARIDNYQCVVKTEDWAGKTKGIYVCPDTILPDKPEYAWLGGKLRIKARKFRNEWSEGLLLPAPEDAVVGTDMFETLQLTHYEPGEPGRPGSKLGRAREYERHPNLSIPVYDLETAKKYAGCFEPGEPLFLTEKIHGCGSKYVYARPRHKYRGLSLIERVKKFFSKQEYEFFIGSRKRWLRDGDNVWYKISKLYPQIERFCKDYPDHILYGEIFGSGIQSLQYGKNPGEIAFAAFDIRLPDGKYMDVLDAFNLAGEYTIPYVPVIDAAFKYDLEELKKLADGSSLIPGAQHQIREGLVASVLQERYSDRLRGRVKLKLVSNEYLQKA